MPMGMTSNLRGGTLAALLAATAAASAGTPGDYAHRWPLQAGNDSPAWHVDLSPQVLEALQDPAQGDFEVFDATGASMPVARAGIGAGRDWLPALFLGGAPADGEAGDAGVMSYRFQLPAVHGIDRARVQLAAGSAPLQVALQYRTGNDWTTAARLIAAPASDPSAAVDTPLATVASAREWRLQSGRVLTPAPALQLGARPPRYVFLARGTGPYMLAAGHTTLRRQATPLEAELAQLRSRRGAAWQPPVATLGVRDAVPAMVAPPVEPGHAWGRWAAWTGLFAVLALAMFFAWRRRRPA
jgi:MYXO-CTERM domain-containing protein